MAHKEPKLEVKEEEETRQNIAQSGAKPKVKKEEKVAAKQPDDSTPIDQIIYCGHQVFKSLTAELVSCTKVLKVTDNSVAITKEELKELKKILEKTSEMVEEKIEFLTKYASSSPLPRHFHNKYGEHINLEKNQTLAERMDTGSKTVVISEMPMIIGTRFTVKVKSTAYSRDLYLAVGVTWTDPETKDNEIKNASYTKKLKDSLIINSSNIVLCEDANIVLCEDANKEFKSKYGEALKSIKDTVGIEIDKQNYLHLYIDGKEGEVEDNVIRRFRFISPCWAIFDVRGWCKSIEIVPCATSE